MKIELTVEELIVLHDALEQYDDEYARDEEHKICFNLITRLEQNKELREHYIEIYKKYDWEWLPYGEDWGC